MSEIEVYVSYAKPILVQSFWFRADIYVYVITVIVNFHKDQTLIVLVLYAEQG